MGILDIVRAHRRLAQEDRVMKLEAASGDREAQLRLIRKEKKLLQEKEDIRKEQGEVRDLRLAPVKRFAKRVQNFRKEKGRSAPRKNIVRKGVSNRTEQTRSIFGSGGSDVTRNILGGGTKGNDVFGGGETSREALGGKGGDKAREILGGK